MLDRSAFTFITIYKGHTVHHLEGGRPYEWAAVHAERPSDAPLTIFSTTFDGIRGEIDTVASSGQPGGRRTA